MAAQTFRYNPDEGYKPRNSKPTAPVQPKKSTFQQQQGAAYGAMDKNPYFQEYYNTLTGLQKGLGRSSGGGGGGGGGAPRISTPTRSAGLGSFGGGLMSFISDQMENDPLGQKAVNVRTMSTDMALQQELDRLGTQYGNTGQYGGPQHQAAIQEAKANAAASNTQVIQQMAEASSQRGLQVSQIATQAYSQFALAEDRLSSMVMQGQKMNADLRMRAAAASAAAGAANLRNQLQLAGMKFSAATGQEDRYSGRFAQGQRFDRGTFESDRSFDYTKSFNDRAFKAQDKAARAQKTGGILGFIGKAIGGVGGFLLGGPAGAAAGAAAGSFLGGASGQGGDFYA